MHQQKNDNRIEKTIIEKDNVKKDDKMSSIDKLFLKRIKDLEVEEQKMLLALYEEIKV